MFCTEIVFGVLHILSVQRKKRYSRLSVGCAVLTITTGKRKDTVVCLAGARSITTGKKRYSHLSVGCAVLAIMRKKRYITTGKKRYSRLSDGCAVLAITTGKRKRYSRLSGGLCCMEHFFCCGGKVLLLPEKKIQSSVWRVRDHYNNRKKNRYDRKKKVPVVCLVRVSVFGQ